MTTLQDYQIPRDLVECLRIEARHAVNPPTEYVVADDGGRMIHKPKPDMDMAELLDQAANRITADGATIAALERHAEALAEALAKIMPIRVHDGQDYAEVHFADGSSHSTQAMTMNPQDWLDIQAAYDAMLSAAIGEG
ncbi:hypothetical protein SAMN02927924_01389 [Sphingobium faniae]|nr:hypothetical protein SAMN02927924_01389 [Sphingobium faniae]